MRVTSGFWVAAYMKSQEKANRFPFLRKRGAEEAGAIFVVVDKGQGAAELYGPAYQASYQEDTDERCFCLLLENVDRLEIAERLDRETNFDSDCWIVEIEAADGVTDLPLSDDEI